MSLRFWLFTMRGGYSTRYAVVLLCIQCCFLVPLEAGIVAKSSINQCISTNDVKARNGQPCSKMLVVALTVTGDEVHTSRNICLSFCASGMHYASIVYIGQISVFAS